MKRLLFLVLAAAVVVLGVVALAPQSIEMPADYDPAFIKPRIDWSEVVAYPPTEPGNAAQPYIQIVREYLRPGPGPSVVAVCRAGSNRLWACCSGSAVRTRSI